MSLETVLQNVLSYSLQLAVLVGVGAGLAALLRLDAPRWALAFWQALFAAALALPFLQPWRPAEPVPASGGAADVNSLASAVARAEGPDWLRLAAALLVAGILWRLVRLGLGLLALRRFRLRAHPLDEPPWDTVGRALGVSPRVLLSPDVAAPATFGLLRPVVLLPRGVEALPVEQRRALVLHEAIHVRRRHWLQVLVEEAVRAVLWFHPAMAWLLARIRLCREQAVDREVVRLTGAREAYLQTLVAMARGAALGRPVPAPLFLKPSHLKRRVELLLKEVSMSTRRACLTLVFGPAALVLAGSLAAATFPFEGPPPAAAEPSADEPVKPAKKKKPPKGAETGGVVGGVVGGVPGGVVGGVPDGVAGGVPGGIEGGLRDAPEDPKPESGGDAGGKKGKNLSAPQVLYKVQPLYPAEAKKEGVEGVVVLRVKVEKSGEVSQVRTVQGGTASRRVRDGGGAAVALRGARRGSGRDDHHDRLQAGQEEGHAPTMSPGLPLSVPRTPGRQPGSSLPVAARRRGRAATGPRRSGRGAGEPRRRPWSDTGRSRRR